jgi:hypothetical protein
MTSVYYLKYDRWIKATYKLLDYVAESAKTWHEMPGYRKHGRLTYLGELGPNLSILQTGERAGKLSRSQIRQLRNLERLAKQAQGTIKVLSDDYEAQRRRADDDS